MKALRWYGKGDVRVENVPEPKIQNPHDAIIQVTSCAICGSDLHLYGHFVPTMEKGDILGHEFMGRVVEKGPAVKNLAIGDRVVVPFPISCGECFFCKKQLWSLCDNTNPNASMAEQMFGYSAAGIFGYSHLFGGYPGGQAEYVRVPHADVGPYKIPSELTDEQVLFLGDIFPTGYMAAEACNIQPGDIIAIWGCGPVGLFAMKSAYLLGAEKVIAIDRFPERLQMAVDFAGADPLNYEEVDSMTDELKHRTGGRGPDACIDAVGMEAHGMEMIYWYDRAKQAVGWESDRPIALREMIIACRKGGTLSIPGVYGGFDDKMPMGALFNKGLTVKTGQTHVHRYLRPLLERIQRNEIDPSRIITHRMKLDEAPEGYKIFRDKKDNCIKVVLKP